MKDFSFKKVLAFIKKKKSIFITLGIVIVVAIGLTIASSIMNSSRVSLNSAPFQLDEDTAIEAGTVYPGIAVCGSGEGISMTLNKHQGVRAGLCWIPEIAHLIRQHNDANVLVMPGRFIDNAMADAIMDEFFATDFEGGRHQRRVEKIPCR